MGKSKLCLRRNGDDRAIKSMEVLISDHQRGIGDGDESKVGIDSYGVRILTVLGAIFLVRAGIIK